MSRRALHFSSVEQIDTLSDLIQEEVTEAFIIKKDITVFYATDPIKEGINYRVFLHKQEMSLPTQAFSQMEMAAYTDESGDHYISSLSPLIVDDNFLGNLYLRISADKMVAEKHEILLLFTLGSLLTVLLTTITEALIIYKLFVPRIANASKILAEIETGDFTAPTIPSDPPDQLGKLLNQTNGMIKTVSSYTTSLHQLTAAGELLAEPRTRQQLLHVAVDLVKTIFAVQEIQTFHIRPGQKSQIPGKAANAKSISFTADRRQLIMLLPSPKQDNELVQMAFARRSRATITHAKNQNFILSLSRMMNNAARRVQILEEIILAEEKYRDFFSSAVEGIFRSTSAGRFEEVNPSLAAMSGYSSPREMVETITDMGKQYYVSSDDQDIARELVDLYGQINDHETEFRRKDGSVFPASVSGRAIKNEQGITIAYEGRIVNIEERKLREKAEKNREAAEAISHSQALLLDDLEEKKHQLQNSLEEKEILLREICHRTKNNMLVIISMLKLQLRSIDDASVLSIFKETENRIRAMSIVHEKLYKSENLTAIDLGSYLEDMASFLVKNMVLDDKVTIDISTEPIPISIDVAVPLGLAVNEVITNSIKHAFPGNRKGKISMNLCQNSDNVIELSIADDGIGIPKSYSSEKSKSFGLEMAQNLICKQIQGSFSMNSNGGTVTRIRFTEQKRIERL